jgi:Na+-translocating ferredoxin:NAD+ oxidoreductase RnfG subunit
MLTYLEDNLLFVLAVVVVILFALIAGGILFLCYKWRQEEIDEEAARRVVCLIKAKPDVVRRWIEEVSKGETPS